MSDAAHPTTSLLQQIRSSYVQGTGPLSVKVAPVQPVSATPSTQDQLAALDTVLTQVEAQLAAQQPAPVTPSPAIAAAMPLAIDQATNTLNPPTPGGTTAKEAIDRGTHVEQPPVDAGTGIQVVEVEPTPEISPEVAEYLQRVEQNDQQQPQEIVIAGDTAQLIPQAPTLKPVIVLPITPEVEAAGAKKNPQWSVRWLVEWSRRLMKMFSGKILYADSET